MLAQDFNLKHLKVNISMRPKGGIDYGIYSETVCCECCFLLPKKDIIKIITIWILLGITSMYLMPTIITPLITLNEVVVPVTNNSTQYLIDKFIDLRLENGLNNVDLRLEMIDEQILFKNLSYWLIMDSLRNKSVFFYGDSLIYGFAMYVPTIINQYISQVSSLLIPCMDYNNSILSTTIECVHHMVESPTNNVKRYRHNSPKLTTNIYDKLNISIYSAHQFTETVHFDHKSNLFKLPQNLMSIGTNKYNVIISNFHIAHILHLYPSRLFESNAIDLIIHLETYFDQFIDLILSDENNKQTKCILFQSMNPICHESYTGKYEVDSNYYMNLFENHNSSYSYRIIIECLMKFNLNETHIYQQNNITGFVLYGIDICTNYTLTGIGSITLNKRIQLYLSNKQKEIQLKKPYLKLLYYDVFKLFNGNNKCQYTEKEDGRHYPPLYPLELMSLLNIIKIWC
eukprot:201606_1